MPTDLITRSGRAVSRLGLGGSPGMEPDAVQAAWDGGVSWFFLYDLSFDGTIEGVRGLAGQHGDDLVIATGSEDRDPTAAERAMDATCTRLGVDGVDVLFAEYVNPDDDVDAFLAGGGLLDVMASWRDAGRIRYVGVTCHSRPLALRLLADARLDILMHRYNMAHRGAEEAVLPAAQQAGVPVCAFTCTRWGSLLQGHADWDGDAPSAADCYRFAQAHPAVRLALTAPATAAQMRANLAAMTPESVDEAQMERWRRYGALVYGDGKGAFETDWP